MMGCGLDSVRRAVAAVSCIFGLTLLRAALDAAREPAWPPSQAMLQIGAEQTAAARTLLARDARGRVRSLAAILAQREERLGRAAVGHIMQRTVHAPAPTQIEQRVTIPVRGRLVFDYALLPQAWNGPRGGVRFAVTVSSPCGRTFAHWSDTITTGAVRERRWRGASIDLAAHGGERAILRFATSASGLLPRRTVSDLAVWGDPVLLGSSARLSRPDVVLILVDALRADHVACYGYRRATTPTIDRLARQGIRFARAYAQAPWTLPSLAALLTCDYPSRVRDPAHLALAPQVTTFPEALRGHGYACAAVTANPVATWSAGFDRGFDFFDASANRTFTLPHSAQQVTERALSWLRRRSGEPFFLFVHYMDPHDPYNPPEPYRSKFLAPNQGPTSPLAAAGDAKAIEDSLIAAPGGKLSAHEIRVLVALYDAAIRYADAHIAQLVAELERLRLRDNTAIIVTADHGEEFRDHGWIRHGHSLYRESLHVPLIVAAPGAAAGQVVEHPVRLIDVGPTVLHLARVSDRFGRGQSLLTSPSGGGGRDPVFAELGPWLIRGPRRHQRPGRSVISDRWHLIAWDDGEAELYDMAQDPGERRNLIDAAPRQARLMMAQLREVAASTARVSAAKCGRPGISEYAERQLRALGYVQ